MNTLDAVSIVSPYGETEECAKLVIEDTSVGYLLDGIAETGQQYTLQFWVKAASSASVTVAGTTFPATTAWTECVTTFEAASPDLVFSFSDAGTYYIFEPQLETGNQQTDYSEAPEDAEERLENEIKITAEGLQGRITAVQNSLGDAETRLQNNIDLTAGHFNAELTKRVLQVDYDGKMTEIESEFTRVNAEAGKLKLEVGEKVTQEDVDKSIGAIDEFHGTTVDITGDGFALKTGGTFDVQAGASVKIATGGTFELDAPNFDVSADGEINAKNARLSGQLSVDGNNVWHKGEIVLSTVQPSNLKGGMLWVKPDTSSIPAAGTWTHPDLNSRVNQATYDIELSGASIGGAPSNAIYTYSVSVPIFHSYSNENAYKVRVYAGSSLGDKKVDFGEQSFAAKGNHTYEATVTSTQWIGNSDKIYLRIELDNYAYLAVNKGEVFTCTLTAKSNSGGTGWKPCTVQMYMG